MDRDKVERVYNAIVNACGNVAVKIVSPTTEVDLGGDGDPLTITTEDDNLVGKWETVVVRFQCPWMYFKNVRDYVKKNDLLKLIIEDDCSTKMEIWAKFKDYLVEWACGELWGHEIKSAKLEKAKVEPKVDEATVVKRKPIHKNVAVVGTATATPAVGALAFLYHVLPAPIATALVGLISFFLAIIEHHR